MSYLTPCNYCTLEDIKLEAMRAGKRVTIIRGQNTVAVTVLVHSPDETPSHENHFAAWLMELTCYCVC